MSVTEIDTYVIDRIREMRIAKSYSQARLSYELGQTAGFIAQIESGKYGKKYNMAHLNAIALIFKCSPKDFLPDKPIKPKK